MANDREGLISSSLQLGASASRADTYGRPGGLRSGVEAKAKAQPDLPAAPAATGMPTVVMVVAVYEFCRAIIVGGVFGIFVSNPGSQLASHTLWQIFFVVSNGSLRVTSLSLISCIYGLAIGLALFLRVDWGRRILIGTSAYSMVRLARFLALSASASTRLSSDATAAAGMDFVRNCIYMLVAVNVAIGLCMMYAPGIQEWFRRKA